ncbi:MAG TPA: thioredoxin domain-containing protein, partial [Sediminibacterium sp.]|nr:thioredoxin domain-containing protein [Sediminibacterium sp.]
AEWCGPCKMMAPILQQVKQQVGDAATILKLDVDKNPEMAARYQIQGVPTLVLFQHGKPVWRKSGVVPAVQLTQLIQQWNTP